MFLIFFHYLKQHRNELVCVAVCDSLYYVPLPFTLTLTLVITSARVKHFLSDDVHLYLFLESLNTRVTGRQVRVHAVL